MPSLQTRQTFGYYLAFAALGIALASLGPTIPTLAENISRTPGELGFLFSARSLGYLLGSFVIGRLYDRLPGNRLIAIALIIMAVMAFLTPLADYLWLLAAFMLAIGLGEGGLDVGGNTLLAWVYAARVAPFLNGMYFLAGAGGFIAPLVIGWLLESRAGLRGAYWVVAFAMLPAAIWLVRTPSPAPPGTQQSTSAQPVKIRLVLPFAALFFIYVGVEVSYGGWIYTYILERGLGSPAIASSLTSGFWLALALGRLLAVPVSTRFRPQQILLLELILGCLAMSLILIGPANLTLVTIGTLGMGLALSAIFPTTFAIVERVLPLSGKLAGGLWASGSSGGIVIPWFVGFLIDSYGGIWMMGALFTCMLCGLLLYWRMRNLTVNQAGV